VVVNVEVGVSLSGLGCLVDLDLMYEYDLELVFKGSEAEPQRLIRR
jgi:hypothetical protein